MSWIESLRTDPNKIDGYSKKNVASHEELHPAGLLSAV